MIKKILKKKKTQIYEILQFTSMNFDISKLLQDNSLLVVIIYCQHG